MPEPWPAVISALAMWAAAPAVNWPKSQRRVVRCSDNLDEDGNSAVSARSRAMRLRGRTEPRAVGDAMVLEALASGPAAVSTLASLLHCSRPSISNRLTRLQREGRVRRVGPGMWAL